jgi:opacity protein-like surface antigen
MNARFSAILVTAAVLAAAAAPAAGADVRLSPNPGFYGGVSLRQEGADGSGVTFGHLATEWLRFASPVADDTGSRALLFGGYRWSNDLSVEAAVGTRDRYALQRTDALGRSGVGLAVPGLALPAGTPDAASRSWNVDLYGSWGFWRAFSLYGRLGYVQPEAVAFPTDIRRSREGVNYGLGLRYDMTRSFGLKFEYARFGHLFGERFGTTLPESDQVQFGLQYRF